jgi:hypothetical protein
MKCSITAVMLGWFLVITAVAEPPVVAEIRLDADPAKCLSGQPGNAMEMSPSHVRKFKILPGLADASLVSLEAVGFTGSYVRHQKFVFYLMPRPKQLNPLFDSDATFKLIQLDGDKVRFEASNYPGKFITTRDDGAVILTKDPPLSQSTFVLKKQ